MLKNFRSYSISIEFYRAALALALPSHLKDQLRRAASSITLNLAEGSGKTTYADQRRFYAIAMGSLRECQAVLALLENPQPQLEALADKLGAHIFKLMQSRE